MQFCLSVWFSVEMICASITGNFEAGLNSSFSTVRLTEISFLGLEDNHVINKQNCFTFEFSKYSLPKLNKMRFHKHPIDCLKAMFTIYAASMLFHTIFLIDATLSCYAFLSPSPNALHHQRQEFHLIFYIFLFYFHLLPKPINF